MNWTIAFNGTEKLIADWGFSRLRRRRVSQGIDEVSFVAEGSAADAPAFFVPFQAILTLWRDRQVNNSGQFSGGTIWFVGLVTQIPREGSPEAESNAYKMVGPWWYLDSMVFEKTFNIFNGYSTPTDPRTAPTYVQQSFSHCFLNLTNSSLTTPFGRLTTGGQIIEALAWALKPYTDAGAAPPFQIGDISPALNVPFDEVRDITCAEVIHKMLRWSPDAATRFDYSTTPPTLHCLRRAELATVDIDISNGTLVKSFQVNPRFDLQSSYVLIRYEQTQNIDGVSWMVPTTDHYPDPLPTGPLHQFNALRFTVDLQGLSATNTSATLACEPIQAIDPRWWVARHDELKALNPGIPPNASDPLQIADPNNQIVKFEIIADSITRTPTTPGEVDLGYANELTSGQLTDWMTAFKGQRITMSCKANVTRRNGTVSNKQPLVYQFLSTNATSGTYENSTISSYAEPVPVGLAQDLYDAVSVLQYEGQLILQEAEVSGRINVGDLINLVGGNLVEWSGMRAMVQEVNENLDEGTTTVRFGPPPHLSAGELVDLLRVNRNRLVHYSPSLQVTGSAGGSAKVSLGNNTPEKNSSSTIGHDNPHVVSTNIDGSGPQVIHASDPITGASTQWICKPGPNGEPPAIAGSVVISLTDAAGLNIAIQPVPVCQNGVQGKIWFLCSTFVPDP